MSSNLYWIWLSLRMGAGRSGFVELLEHFGTPENIYSADASELLQFKKNKWDSRIDALLDKNLENAYNIEKYCAKKHIQILKYKEKGYPVQLLNLKNPPVILYAKGNINNLDKKVCISIVGTRKLTEYGRRSAYKIGYELASAGAVVVSGMALGIDAVAACGALDARGKTIAVLGSGIDYIYPPEHKKLSEQIIKNGLILSEYPPLEAPTRGSFPTRNRIISGLSQGTLVIEADQRSGALITAKDAIIQGRDIYSLPGNINNPTSQGTNSLIKDGATPITCAADILENYKYIYRESLDMSALSRIGDRSELKFGALSARGVDEGDDGFAVKKEGAVSSLLHSKKRVDGETVNRMVGNTAFPQFEAPPKLVEMSEEEKRATSDNDTAKLLEGLDEKYLKIYNAIPAGESVSLDTVCRAGYEPRTAMPLLTALEMKGLITVLPGGLYRRK